MEIALGLESLACRCNKDQPICLCRDDLNKPVVLLETFCIAFPGDEFKAIVPETVIVVQDCLRLVCNCYHVPQRMLCKSRNL